jgi:type III secretory pathway component EscT
VTALLIAFARTGGFAWLAVPVRPAAARLLVGVALALAVAPMAVPPDGVELALVLAREAAVGLALGLVASVPLRAAEMAGLLTDGARRRSRPDHGAPVGALMRWLALALFAAADGPRVWVAALADGYGTLPVGRPLAGGAPVVIDAVARLIVQAVELAAPALAALLVADAALGLVGRASPSLAPTGSGRAARELAAVGALAACAGAVSVALAGGFGALGHELALAARGLAG